jgi:prepilin-type N-terminal cleavage/methylation domain-containing protein
MRRHRHPSAFTLIELMMVVAILSILASIAIPKFGNMVIKTRESVVKSSLGALRAAISIYYSDTEGVYPGGGTLNTSLTAGGRYLTEMPTCQIPAPGNHPGTSGVTDYAGSYTDGGDWMYFVSTGGVTVNCTHSDTLGRLWYSN